MRKMSVQRRKVVLMAAGVSVMASMETLVPRHLPAHWEWVRWAWLGLVVVLLVVVGIEMKKLQRDEC